MFCRFCTWQQPTNGRLESSLSELWIITKGEHNNRETNPPQWCWVSVCTNHFCKMKSEASGSAWLLDLHHLCPLNDMLKKSEAALIVRVSWMNDFYIELNSRVSRKRQFQILKYNFINDTNPKQKSCRMFCGDVWCIFLDKKHHTFIGSPFVVTHFCGEESAALVFMLPELLLTVG